MKFWLAVLAPWMAATAALGQDAQAVSVEYTHQGVSSQDIIRVGEDCFAAPYVVRKWGWEVTTRYSDADVDAEGRTIRVKMLSNKGKPMISLTEAARFLGAKSSWSEDGKTYRMRSWIRNVEATKTGLKVDGTLPYLPRTFKLAGPDRFVVDLVGAEFTPGSFANLPQGWRVGQVSDNTVRIVIEHPEMALQPINPVSQGRSLEIALRTLDPSIGQQTGPINGQPIPVTAVLAPALTLEQDSKSIELLIPVRSGTPGSPTAKFITPHKIEVTIPKATPADPISSGDLGTPLVTNYSFIPRTDSAVLTLTCAKAMAFQVSPSKEGISVKVFLPAKSDGKMTGKIIVLDAGHGGHDSGAKNNSVMEKTIALAITKETGRQLTAMGASVIFTRTDDTFVGLGERSAVANRSNASIFVSIHINSNTVADSRSGTISFHHKQDPVGMLLTQCIHTEMVKVSKLPNIGVWSDQRIYKSGFAVLRNSEMPSTLLELGFINHKTDRARMQQLEFQQSIAKAIAEGVRIFFGGKEK